MKRPTKEVFRGAYNEIHYERYTEHLNKFINHILSKNKELIEVYDEYIELLGKSLSRHGGFMASRPYIKMDSQEEIDKGVELRAKIKALKTNKK